MTKLSAIVVIGEHEELPREQKIDRGFQKIEETIQALSSVVPHLAQRVLKKDPRVPAFLVSVTPDEYADLAEYLSTNDIGHVMIDGPMVRPGS